MGTLASIGFFDSEVHPVLKSSKRPTFKAFLLELLQTKADNVNGTAITEKDIAQKLIHLGHCQEEGTAKRTAKTIMLVFYNTTEILALHGTLLRF